MAKHAGVMGLAKVANTFDTMTLTTLTKSVTIPSAAGTGLSVGVHALTKVATVASLMAGFVDIAVHHACQTYDPDYFPGE